jgi:SulP family sulfate permease
VKGYSFQTFGADALAGAIVAIMLIPQSIAYALMAGLPPEVGLYASMAPLVAYAVFGGSRELAVGPVAVVSLMTASAIGEAAAHGGTASAIELAAMLAALSGACLLGAGLLRIGGLGDLLSQPVVSGFVTAAALLIAAGQAPQMLGLSARGSSLFEIMQSIAAGAAPHAASAALGLAALVLLLCARRFASPLLTALGLRSAMAHRLARAAPLLVVGLAILVVRSLDLGAHGVSLVGTIPQGLPTFQIPRVGLEDLASLLVPAVLLSVVGFVESVSVARTFAMRRGARVDSNQELVALGVANLAAAGTGGFPVTGGLARSVVNAEAGAETPAAGAFAAAGIAICALALTPVLADLPRAVLAAMVIAAIVTLIDLRPLATAWRFSRRDFAAAAATILLTLGVGVEAGIVAGLSLSLALHLHRASRPTLQVLTSEAAPGRAMPVGDESAKLHDADALLVVIGGDLFFGSARHVEDQLVQLAVDSAGCRRLVLGLRSVNVVDSSGFEALLSLDDRLAAAGITLHLCEASTALLDRLQRSPRFARFADRVHPDVEATDAAHSELGWDGGVLKQASE